MINYEKLHIDYIYNISVTFTYFCETVKCRVTQNVIQSLAWFFIHQGTCDAVIWGQQPKKDRLR
jgi:hypothetical protein